MANKLVKSNRHLQNNILKPQEIAHASDFEETEKKSDNISSVTFDTNLKITNHTRNKLQSLAVLGYAENQKTSIDIIFESYMETLTNEERKEIDLQIETLEKRDVRKKK